jgi:hypothetical protein
MDSPKIVTTTPYAIPHEEILELLQTTAPPDSVVRPRIKPDRRTRQEKLSGPDRRRNGGEDA